MVGLHISIYHIELCLKKCIYVSTVSWFAYSDKMHHVKDKSIRCGIHG